MNQCINCRTKADVENGLCPVCGMDQQKPRNELTPEEKHVRHCVRRIRLTAVLHLLLAVTLIVILSERPNPSAIVLMAVINLVLAFGLIRYAFWAYRVAVVVYFLAGIVFIISVNIPLVLVVLTLLHVVGNKTAKAVFERRLPESL